MKLGMRVACVASVLAACSGTSNGSAGDGGNADGADASNANDGGTPPADSSSEAAAADAASDAAPVCNTLANVAQPVTITQVASDPPTPQGGVMADGTYPMTDATIYTGPQGPTGATSMAQTTIRITGNTIQVVTNGSPETRTETLVENGTQFTATGSCPDTSVLQGAYTATATRLVVLLPAGMDDAGARTLVETFTKQ
jgi:hypothetical protein